MAQVMSRPRPGPRDPSDMILPNSEDDEQCFQAISRKIHLTPLETCPVERLTRKAIRHTKCKMERLGKPLKGCRLLSIP